LKADEMKHASSRLALMAAAGLLSHESTAAISLDGAFVLR
jgi:hypothetical protein